jgi:phosphoribosyl-ATP pyrophosphohydrolase
MSNTSNQHILDALYATVAARKGADPSESYTAKLFAKGTRKIAQKVGEEGVETVIAALAEGPENVASESADLLYHLMVLWADQGVKPEDVWDILAKRQGISGIAEKASRSDN